MPTEAPEIRAALELKRGLFAAWRWPRLSKTLVGVAIIAALCGTLLVENLDTATLALKASHDKATVMSTFVVREQLVEQTVDLGGVVVPQRESAISALFDGEIKTLPVVVGQAVAMGDLLIRVDTREIDVKLREAESQLLKAQSAVNTLANWKSSSEVERSQRSLRQAEGALRTLEREEREAKTLLDRGIIPRNEHDTIVEQLAAQRLQYEGAQQDLVEQLSKSNASTLRVGELEVETATARVAELKYDREQSDLRAPFDGVVGQPDRTQTGGAVVDKFAIGSRVTRGQTLLTVQDTREFDIVAHVDEVDVNKLSPGQSATIVCEAISGSALKAKITRVGSAAMRDDLSGNTARFAVRLSLENSELARTKGLRLGMSARASIVIYRNPHGVVVPPDAIVNENNTRRVRVINRETGVKTLVPVEIGAATVSGVEVLSGLSTGDVVVAGN